MSSEAPAQPRSALPRSAGEMARGWYAELQRISARLQQVHDRALEDPELRARRTALMETIQQAMDRTDPELPRLASRAEQIPAEVQAARGRGDAPRLQGLDRELGMIQARFMNVEQAVLRQPAIAREVRAYEEQLRAEMVRVEPLTESLLARSSELQRLLQAAVSPQQRR